VDDGHTILKIKLRYSDVATALKGINMTALFLAIEELLPNISTITP
jgi:hypothetical protein